MGEKGEVYRLLKTYEICYIFPLLLTINYFRKPTSNIFSENPADLPVTAVECYNDSHMAANTADLEWMLWVRTSKRKVTEYTKLSKIWNKPGCYSVQLETLVF